MGTRQERRSTVSSIVSSTSPSPSVFHPTHHPDASGTMTSLRRRVLVIFAATAIVLSVLLLSSSRLDESHPLSLPGLKTKLLPAHAYLLPLPPTPPSPPEWDLPPPEAPPLHNSTHWIVPDRKNATDLYGMTHERLLASFPTGPDEDGAASVGPQSYSTGRTELTITCFAPPDILTRRSTGEATAASRHASPGGRPTCSRMRRTRIWPRASRER